MGGRAHSGVEAVSDWPPLPWSALGLPPEEVAELEATDNAIAEAWRAGLNRYLDELLVSLCPKPTELLADEPIYVEVP